MFTRCGTLQPVAMTWGKEEPLPRHPPSPQCFLSLGRGRPSCCGLHPLQASGPAWTWPSQPQCTSTCKHQASWSLGDGVLARSVTLGGTAPMQTQRGRRSTSEGPGARGWAPSRAHFLRGAVCQGSQHGARRSCGRCQDSQGKTAREAAGKGWSKSPHPLPRHLLRLNFRLTGKLQG